MDALTLLHVMHRTVKAAGLSRDAECAVDSIGDYVSGGAFDGKRWLIARHEPFRDTVDGVQYVHIAAWGEGIGFQRAYIPWNATAGDIENALRSRI